MKLLNYEVLKETGYQGYLLEQAPERVLQFGEGNFLRAFTNYWFDVCNEKTKWKGKCCLVQPKGSKRAGLFQEQEGLYTLYLRGVEKGRRINERRVISSVSRCLNPKDKEDWKQVLEAAKSDDLEMIISNTTEAGIVYDPSCQFTDSPADSYPGKLTQVLYARYEAKKPGVLILPCELIDSNGKELRKCVDQYICQWGLEEDFRTWVQEENQFCSTLVDRIVPGGIRDPEEAKKLEEENGYRDELLDVGECFAVWIIEGPKELEERLPFQAAGLNVHVVPDVEPYKKRKVRILNGAHTGFALGAYLAGFDIVRDCMEDEVIHGFLRQMLRREVIPTLPLPKQDLLEFAADVEDRFRNPFVNHELMSISLNSTAKWKARNLPSLLDYTEQTGELPPCLTMSLAAYLAFYSNHIQERAGEGLVCQRPNQEFYTVRDEGWILEFYSAHRADEAGELAQAVLKNQRMWERDLSQIPGLLEAVTEDLRLIREKGVKEAFASCVKESAP